MEEQIIQQASRLFTVYGFRAITMQRLARETGISTKTLYKIFPNKTSVLKTIVELGIEQDRRVIENFTDTREYAIEELLLLFNHFFSKNKELYAGFIDDLKKFQPELYKLIDDYFDNYAEPWLIRNFQRGIEEGHYKKNTDVETMARYLIELSLMALSHSYFPADKFKHGNVYAALYENFMYGIATEKGSAYLDNNFKKYFTQT